MSKLTTFNQRKTDYLNQPMFLGESVNIARYDQAKYPFFNKLTEKQLGFFWRPEEIDISSDRAQFEALPENEKHIFLSNLKYQILLDSVQGRAPNLAFLPLVSIPEFETWIETWSFSETVHSASYTHIIRNLVADPSVVFDSILDSAEIVERAESVTKHYDELIELGARRTLGESFDRNTNLQLEDALFKTMVSVNVLEAVRFYVSFACSYSFAERNLMEGNAKIIKLINRDETLHLAGTQVTLKKWIDGSEGKSWQDCAARNFSFIEECFRDAAAQEKAWADYLFRDGSMVGLTAGILHQYIEYLTDVRMKALGCSPIFNVTTNPIPWIHSWTDSDSIQVAPQETEITSYLTGAVDMTLSGEDFKEFEL